MRQYVQETPPHIIAFGKTGQLCSYMKPKNQSNNPFDYENESHPFGWPPTL